eukprot:3158090-Prymnesium_polylepis.3
MQCLSCAATLLVVHGVAAAPKLHDAASQNNDHTIQAFLDAGADLNLRDPATGQTPLMFSVLNGFAASVRYLLSAGADTSIGENDGYTPLHGAAFQGRADIAKILIDHGLDPNEVHSDGYTVRAPARALAKPQPPTALRLCCAPRAAAAPRMLGARAAAHGHDRRAAGGGRGSIPGGEWP